LVGAAGKRYQGVYQLTWVGGWTEAGIQGLFTPLYGKADVV
jgi:hypothetical protein